MQINYKSLIKIIILISSLPAVVFAEAHGGHETGLDEHTIKTIIYQAINVFALIAGLIYFLKTPVKKHFLDKRASYLALATKAESSRAAAEDEHEQIKIRLSKLESTAEESLLRARAEAVEMRDGLILEAKSMAKRIHEEAEQSAKLEVVKAKNLLRKQMIQEATDLARNQMQSKVSTEDHKRLQGDFISNIQAVQR